MCIRHIEAVLAASPNSEYTDARPLISCCTSSAQNGRSSVFVCACSLQSTLRFVAVATEAST